MKPISFFFQIANSYEQEKADLNLKKKTVDSLVRVPLRVLSGFTFEVHLKVCSWVCSQQNSVHCFLASLSI